MATLAGSVWLLPLLKLIGFCSVLTCIAWLGERSREENVYGPEIAEREARPSPAPQGQEAKAPAQAPVAPPPAVAPTLPAAPPPCAPASVEAPRPTSALLADGRLVLNEATVQDLDRLPGIGQKRAEEIVALRTRLGRFKRTTELLRVRGIGPRSLASLQEHLVLDRPTTSVPVDATTATKGEVKRPGADPPRPE